VLVLTGFRNGIVATLMQRVAFNNTLECKPNAPDRTMMLNSVNCILGTAGIKTAPGRKQITDVVPVSF
jgi:hypothetical protein